MHDPEDRPLVVRRPGPEVEEHDPDAVDGVEDDAGDQAQLAGAEPPAERPVVGAGEDSAVDVHREIVLGGESHHQERVDDVNDEERAGCRAPSPGESARTTGRLRRRSADLRENETRRRGGKLADSGASVIATLHRDPGYEGDRSGRVSDGAIGATERRNPPLKHVASFRDVPERSRCQTDASHAAIRIAPPVWVVHSRAQLGMPEPL